MDFWFVVGSQESRELEHRDYHEGDNHKNTHKNTVATILRVLDSMLRHFLLSSAEADDRLYDIDVKEPILQGDC